MNLLHKDLLYECIYFLKWDEYCDVCKYLDLELKFNIYCKYNTIHILNLLNKYRKEKERTKWIRNLRDYSN